MIMTWVATWQAVKQASPVIITHPCLLCCSTLIVGKLCAKTFFQGLGLQV